MRLAKTTLIALGLAAWIAGFAAHKTGWAQQNPPDASTTTLKVTTQLTVVDVTVTDSNGKRIHDLKASDFTVKEDGKPQPLRSFQQYGKEIPSTNSTQAALPPLPPNVYTNQQQPAPTTGALNVLLLDDVNTAMVNGLLSAPGNVMYAKQQAISYLKNMPSGTQVAILKLGNGVHVVQGFTSDRDVLLAAMNSTSAEAVAGTTLPAPPLPQVPPPPPPSEGEICAVLNARSQRTVYGLAQVAAFLSDIKGRKNLIWFTSGIPWLTNYQGFGGTVPYSFYGDLPAQRSLIDYTPQLRRVYGRLTAAEVALYPVDPRGVFSDPSGDANNPGLKIASGCNKTDGKLREQRGAGT